MNELQLRSEHFGPHGLVEISEAGSVFASAVSDTAHHSIGEPGLWECWGTPVQELTRLREVLTRMESAVKQTRARLADIELRARLVALDEQRRRSR